MLLFRNRNDEADGSIPDREVKATIVSRLRENPYTQDAHIKVTVQDGAVRLEGNVADPDARAAAVRDVEVIPGVADLEVDLTIAA